jgi:hypothetical protein
VLRAVLDPGVLTAGLISAKEVPCELLYRWRNEDFERGGEDVGAS